MGGLLAHFPEVIDGSYQAGSEEMVPDPVHRDTGGERIFSGGYPFGQLQPAAFLV